MTANRRYGGAWRRACAGAARLRTACAARLTWREAVEWAQEQDRRREVEQLRFAQERLRVELEALWSLPASTPAGRRASPAT